MPITEISDYSEKGGTLAEKVRIDAPGGGESIRIEFQRNRETGETKGTIGIPASSGITPEVRLRKSPSADD